MSLRCPIRRTKSQSLSHFLHLSHLSALDLSRSSLLCYSLKQNISLPLYCLLQRPCCFLVFYGPVSRNSDHSGEFLKHFLSVVFLHRLLTALARSSVFNALFPHVELTQ